jgi:hypothetical protein
LALRIVILDQGARVIDAADAFASKQYHQAPSAVAL